MHPDLGGFHHSQPEFCRICFPAEQFKHIYSLAILNRDCYQCIPHQNIMFQYPIMDIGNIVQLVAMISLLWQMLYTLNCTGVSAKTQFLLALVYTTRYLDLLTTCFYLYNSIMKVLIPPVTYGTLLAIYYFRKSYERKHDTFRIETLLVPCLVFVIFFNDKFTVQDTLWEFSEYLEAVALIPQFVLLENTRRAHKFMLRYIAAHTISRCLFIVQYIVRYLEEDGYNKLTASTAIVHVFLCLDFFVTVGLKLEPVIDEDKKLQIATIPSNVAELEGQHPDKDSNFNQKSGYLSGNMSTILLSLTSLFGKDNNKIKFLKIEEKSILKEASVNKI